MESFQNRLRSFYNWQRPEPPQVEQLALEGFFHEPFTYDGISCFSCGFFLNQWQPLTQPWFEHARYNPECEALRLVLPQTRILMATRQHPAYNMQNFMEMEDPTLSQYEAWNQRLERQGLTPVASLSPEDNLRNWKEAKKMDTILSSTPVRHRGTQTYELRWTNLKMMPGLSPEMQESLARCGYHYPYVANTVRCAYCSFSFDPQSIKDGETSHSAECPVLTWRNNLYFTCPQAL
jgi:Inhibitor of Apoptosis domain